MHRSFLAAAALVAIGTAHAQTRTYVTFAGKNDVLPKLGLPGITVEVFGPRVEDSAAVLGEIARELATTVHTRPLAKGEAGDYALAVTLQAPVSGVASGTVPFEAVLRSTEGKTIWRVDGRTEIEKAGVEVEALTSIGRNVVSALIHDGWLAPRYDPEDPPPAPPTIRRVGSGAD
jgi:hypothetical protein